MKLWKEAMMYFRLGRAFNRLDCALGHLEKEKDVPSPETLAAGRILLLAMHKVHQARFTP